MYIVISWYSDGSGKPMIYSPKDGDQLARVLYSLHDTQRNVTVYRFFESVRDIRLIAGDELKEQTST